MKLSKLLFGVLLLIILVAFYSDFDIVYNKITGKAVEINPMNASSKTPAAANPISEETNKKPIILFCQKDSCLGNLIFLINNSEKIHCALYDIDIPELADILAGKSAAVVIDKDNYPEGGIKDDLDLRFTKQDNNNQLMHNKFCVFDSSIVWTGSFNPTFNDNERNDNNAVVVFSEYLAQNYEDEFQELWNGIFGANRRSSRLVKYQKIKLNENIIENYFCPEDNCAEHIINVLDAANESIYFMAFSFTHDGIGKKLIEKHKQGIGIKGMVEKKQGATQYSEYPRLKDAGIDVFFDGNKYNMHHKVFIIDKKIVVTGSFNPTQGGDTRNDENILILHDENIAARFMEEFDDVLTEARQIEETGSVGSK